MRDAKYNCRYIQSKTIKSKVFTTEEANYNYVTPHFDLFVEILRPNNIRRDRV